MTADYYPLSDVLAIASVHPFYSDATYPPTRDELPSALASAKETTKGLELSSFPLSNKDDISRQIARLSIDQDPHNGYRRGTYASITGGGTGGKPVVFATDSEETRRQRAVMGSFVQSCGIIGPGDWVLSMHVAGYLYRALDLTSEIAEGSGATILCAGADMSLEKVVQAVEQYQVNTISGDSGHIVHLARYVAELPEEQKRALQVLIIKCVYTSEPMTPTQQTFVRSIFPGIAISSFIGSAEAGPWAASPGELTESSMHQEYVDFIYDDRLIHLEVLPFSIKEDPNPRTPTVANGEKGLLVQTSLQRLRHPLVRYICGDVASLHSLPDVIKARLAPETAAHYRVVRIYGRDREMSFDWCGEYFSFSTVQATLKTEACGILQYQIIRRFQDAVGAGKPDQQGLSVVLELRLLRDAEGADKISEQELTKKIRTLFEVSESNDEFFDLRYLSGFDGFLRSATGRKVINFVDLTKT